MAMEFGDGSGLGFSSTTSISFNLQGTSKFSRSRKSGYRNEVYKIVRL